MSELYTTDTKLLTEIPITPSGAAFLYRTVAKLLAVPMVEGEIAHVEGAFEVTNPYSYNVMLAGYLKVGAQATPLEGTIIRQAMAVNVTPDMHHYPFPIGGFFKAPATDVYTFRLCGYGAASQATSGANFDLEYVDLQVVA